MDKNPLSILGIIAKVLSNFALCTARAAAFFGGLRPVSAPVFHPGHAVFAAAGLDPQCPRLIFFDYL